MKWLGPSYVENKDEFDLNVDKTRSTALLVFTLLGCSVGANTSLLKRLEEGISGDRLEKSKVI